MPKHEAMSKFDFIGILISFLVSNLFVFPDPILISLSYSPSRRSRIALILAAPLLLTMISATAVFVRNLLSSAIASSGEAKNASIP
jgi:hypothetical protein